MNLNITLNVIGRCDRCEARGCSDTDYIRCEAPGARREGAEIAI